MVVVYTVSLFVCALDMAFQVIVVVVCVKAILLSFWPLLPVPVTLRGKFELSSGPSTPKPTFIQFICDGSTLSGMRLKLDTPAYKVSLYKNKLIAGKECVCVGVHAPNSPFQH